MIFLDTDIISYYFDGEHKIKARLDEVFRLKEDICTTVVNVYEVIKGLRWRDNKQKEAKIKHFLKDIKVFAVQKNVVDEAASIYADLRKKGITIGDADVLIAAVVITNNGTLVTNNTKHFECIKQLKVVKWG